MYRAGLRSEVEHASLCLIPVTPLQAVLAHELGHLKCDHGLWLTVANVLASGTVRLTALTCIPAPAHHALGITHVMPTARAIYSFCVLFLVLLTCDSAYLNRHINTLCVSVSVCVCVCVCMCVCVCTQVSMVPIVNGIAQEALLRWLRAAELTCDRAALLVAQDSKVRTKCIACAAL